MKWFESPAAGGRRGMLRRTLLPRNIGWGARRDGSAGSMQERGKSLPPHAFSPDVSVAAATAFFAMPADPRLQGSFMDIRKRWLMPRRGARGPLVAVALVASLWLGSAQALFTVGPTSDGACQFHDIQSAVTAAQQSPGPDLIQVSQGTYSHQTTITVADGSDVTIEGGYENCSSGNRVDRSTLDAQGASGGPIFVDEGIGALTLLHLILQNANNSSGPGGAISAVVAGPLTLSDVLVYSNRATYGGGLFISGNSIFRPTVTLIDSSINSNTATSNGGGLYVTTAAVFIYGATNFLANLATGTGDTGDGGGIYALDANIHASGHSLPTSPFVGFNQATRYGGGIYYGATANSLEFFLANDNASLPLNFNGNVANYGGALFMSS